MRSKQLGYREVNRKADSEVISEAKRKRGTLTRRAKRTLKRKVERERERERERVKREVQRKVKAENEEEHMWESEEQS